MNALATIPTYEEYKDSGIEWLGKVPNGWDVVRLKNAAIVNPTANISRNQFSIEACFLPMEKVEANGSVNYEIRKPIKELKQGFTSFRKNDVIIAKITPCFENGKGALLDKMPTQYGFGSTEFHVLRALENYSPLFLYYLSKTHLFMDFGERMMTGSAGQKRVPSDYVSEFRFAAPNKDQQTKIANFLDKKTARIDDAIALKEKQIALLKERKQIIIQKVITQGLCPNVPMKDSGVDWIGQIPAHWNIFSNRALFSERVEPGREGLPLLSVSIHSGVSSEEVSEEENVRGRVKIEDKSKYILIKAGDIAFNMMRAWQGGIGASKVDGMVSPAYIVAKPKKLIVSEFFELQYRCPEFIQQMDRYSKGITDFRKRLYWDNFKLLATVVPPVSEQSQIVDFVKAQSGKSDEGVTLLEKQIGKLKEYKTTLINSAVTGKFKVA